MPTSQGRPPAPALPRQERQGARGRPRRSARRPRRPPLPGDARPGPVPVRRRGRRGARRRLGRRQRLHPRGGRRRLHRQGLPHLARQRRMRSASGSSSAPPTPAAGASAKELLGEVAQAPRQHGRGLQEVVRPPARARRRWPPRSTASCSPASTGRRRAGLNAAERRLLAFLGARLSDAGLAQAGVRRRHYFTYRSVEMFRRPGPDRRHPWKNRSSCVSDSGQRPHAGPQPPAGAQQLHRRRCTASCAPRSTPRRPTARSAASSLTGTGRGFCAGQDLADPAVAPNREPGGKPTDVGVGDRALLQAAGAAHPLDAGAGRRRGQRRRRRRRRELRALCDIVVAARSASFIQAFSKIGLVPDCGGTWLLPRLVGRAHALGLAMLGDKLAGRGRGAARPDLEVRRRRRVRGRGRGGGRSAWRRCRRRALAATRAGDRRLAAARLRRGAEPRGRRCRRTLGGAHDYLEGVAAFMAKRAAGLRRPLSRWHAARRMPPARRPPSARTCSPPTARRKALGMRSSRVGAGTRHA